MFIHICSKPIAMLARMWYCLCRKRLDFGCAAHRSARERVGEEVVPMGWKRFCKAILFLIILTAVFVLLTLIGPKAM